MSEFAQSAPGMLVCLAGVLAIVLATVTDGEFWP